MAYSQRRTGPHNIGFYGIISPIINGVNLFIATVLYPKNSLGFTSFGLFVFFAFYLSLFSSVFLLPFFITELYIMFLFIFVFGLVLIYILLFVSYTAYTSYSALGTLRLISLFLSFDLTLTTIIVILLVFFFSFSNSSINALSLNFEGNFLLPLLFLLFITFFTCSLAEANRVPFDLPEAESELVAGFLTEYSSLFFSLIVLLEYSNLILLFLLACFFFLITTYFFLFALIFLLLILSATSAHAIFPRYRYDLALSSFWLSLLCIIFALLLVLLATL